MAFQNITTSAAITLPVLCGGCYGFPGTSSRLHAFPCKPDQDTFHGTPGTGTRVFCVTSQNSMVAPLLPIPLALSLLDRRVGFHSEQVLHYVHTMKSNMVTYGLSAATTQIIKKKMVIRRAKHDTCIQHSPQNRN